MMRTFCVTSCATGLYLVLGAYNPTDPRTRGEGEVRGAVELDAVPSSEKADTTSENPHTVTTISISRNMSRMIKSVKQHTVCNKVAT